ncbi:flagellar assembly protein FliW [uncultured Brevibacillus sp.]|uniref:flagellar assembly protein FliW n=1 Tax=uncultured Brevibacillus sp. TaxID=169970 RepID=UPI0025969C94|nr:flagellar assembly protein FliW [uncultured Brevibacillus sp.]
MSSPDVQSKELIFQDGMPGFPELKRFLLVQGETGSPFFSLQSQEDEQVGFWVTQPFVFFSDYEFTLPDSVKAQLQIEEGTPVFVCNVISFRDGGEMTVNLKAPIVVNESNQLAKQVILNAEQYEIRQPLMQIRAKAASE